MIDVSWSPIFLEGDQATTCFYLKVWQKIKATLTNKSFPKSKTPRQFEEISCFFFEVSPKSCQSHPKKHKLSFRMIYIKQKIPPQKTHGFATRKSTLLKQLLFFPQLPSPPRGPGWVGQWQVPVRAGWLYTLVHEAYDPQMAIRGSRFRGGNFVGCWVNGVVGWDTGGWWATWKF